MRTSNKRAKTISRCILNEAEIVDMSLDHGFLTIATNNCLEIPKGEKSNDF